MKSRVICRWNHVIGHLCKYLCRDLCAVICINRILCKPCMSRCLYDQGIENVDRLRLCVFRPKIRNYSTRSVLVLECAFHYFHFILLSTQDFCPVSSCFFDVVHTLVCQTLYSSFRMLLKNMCLAQLADISVSFCS